MTNNGQLISLSGYNQPFYEQVFTAPVFAAAFKPALDQALHTKADWYANYAGGVTRPGASAAAIFAQLPSRSEEHTSELQSLMRISYAVFCLKKKNHLIAITQ